MRQVHHPAAGERAGAAIHRRGDRRRPGSGRACLARRHGVPESDHAALDDDRAEHHAAAQDRRTFPLAIPQAAQDRIPRQGQCAAGTGRPQGLWQPLSLATFRRHASARQSVPRADPRAAHAPARRAVRRARPVHAGRAVVDPAGPLDRPQADRAAGDARSARGGVSGQPHLRDERATWPHPRRQPRRLCPPAHRRHDLRAGFRGAQSKTACLHRRCPHGLKEASATQGAA